MPVMRQLPIDRRRRQIETGIEALGQNFRRNPMGEGRQHIGGEGQFLRRRQRRHGAFACFQCRGIACAQVNHFRPTDQHPVAAGQQHAGLFETFADCRDPERAVAAFPFLPVPVSGQTVAWLDLAAGKDQRPGCEIDGMMTAHHEDFQPLPAIAQQQYRAGRPWFRHIVHPIPLISVAFTETAPS